MARRLPYGDGDWFAVPLRDDAGFAVGVVARHDRRGGVIGYFFQERFAEVPSLESLPALQARDAVRVMRFGDLGLIKSQWPILGRRNDWSAEDWPMPAFGRREPTGRAFRVIYSPDDLRGPIAEEPIPDDECDQLPRDALSGAGAVERVLTALLVPG
ncbi:MAG: immunity 26/phosphotriesterase HocA family protein [Acidimicrobiales bacterium]|nr:immunity 26/phosphotriesterase HocA family protein [Acidimicrobiales bacterium]